MTVDPREAYQAIDAVFVNHPVFARARSEIRDLIELSPVITAPCIHVSGPSGVGKSTLKMRIKAEYPPVKDGAVVSLPGGLSMVADRYPLLVFTMPEVPTVKSLARAMLKAYGDELWGRGDEYTLSDRVDRFIAASQTRVILIDEAQRAIERPGTVVSDKLIDWIKSRHEENAVGFVLLGLGRLRHLFEIDRQIERRWDAEIRLEPYRWLERDGSPDLDGQANFIGLLAKFRDLSPVPFNFDVEDDEVAFRFFYLSQGLVGGVKKLLLKGVRLLRRTEADAFDFPLLRLAADEGFRLAANAMQNPFADGFVKASPPDLEDDYAVVITKRGLRPVKGRRQKDVARLLTK